MPEIIEFSARSMEDHLFHTMISPINPNFYFAPDASETNGWTKKELMKLPKDQRPTLKKAWEKFLKWIETISDQ